MRKDNKETGQNVTDRNQLLKNVAAQRIRSIRKNRKFMGKKEKAELKIILKNLKKRDLSPEKIEVELRMLIYMQQEIDSKKGGELVKSPLHEIEQGILDRDVEGAEVAKQNRQEKADYEKQITPETRSLNKLNEELKEKANDFLRDFYKGKNGRDFFSRFEKYLGSLKNSIKKNDLGFNYEQVESVFRRLKEFSEKLETVSKRDIAPLEQARLYAKFVKENPAFFEDVEIVHEYAVKLMALDKRKAKDFEKSGPLGLTLSDYTIKFSQWLSKYPLLLAEYNEKKLPSYPKEVATAQELQKDFTALLLERYNTPAEGEKKTPVVPLRSDVAQYQRLIKKNTEIFEKIAQESSPKALFQLKEQAQEQLKEFEEWKTTFSGKDQVKRDRLENLCRKNIENIDKKLASYHVKAPQALNSLNKFLEKGYFADRKYDVNLVTEKLNIIKNAVELNSLIQSRVEGTASTREYQTASKVLNDLDRCLHRAKKSAPLFGMIAHKIALRQMKKIVRENHDELQRAIVNRDVMISSPVQPTKR